jgi:hypothetical protein
MMREYVVRFLWKGMTHEENVSARSDTEAVERITRQYVGCVIISVLHL